MPARSIRPIPVAEALGVASEVLAPLVAQGLILRRPAVVGALDRLDAQRRAIRRLDHVHDRFGPGPAVLRLPHRRLAIVLSDTDARRVLAETPRPFTPATREKRAALSQFEPHGVLISTGAVRERRRRANEQALETDRPVHSLSGEIARVIEEEVRRGVAGGPVSGSLNWDGFAGVWWRIVRRIVLGDEAGGDATVTDALARLRSRANWGPFARRADEVRERFLSRLREAVARAPAGSLAGHAAALDGDVDPVGQIPQWLFAFDAAGMAAFRALALLDAHPEVAQRVRVEMQAGQDPADHPLATLRASLLESLRLWPTTPAILRDTTEETAWRGGSLPAGTGLVIIAPYFHRNSRTLSAADAFSPELWLEGEDTQAVLMPFSLGPASCPGRPLVLLVTSLLLARLLSGRAIRQTHAQPLRADRPLPSTLSPFRLSFSVRAAGADA